MSRLISTFRQRIEARDLPFVAGDWFQVHLGIALGRLGRHSSWVRDFLSTAEEVRPTIRPTT